MESIVARQPIFDARRQVFGYELLFRPRPGQASAAIDGDSATTSVINDALHLHGLASLINTRKCFVNLTRNALLDEVYTTLPPQITVIELLETIEPDAEVISACRKAREQGYLVALDDYILDPKFAPLMPHLDVLKVDVAQVRTSQFADVVAMRQQYGFELLAEKVEHNVTFERARDVGFAYFQGHFFCRPQILQQRSVPESRVNLLRFLKAINEPDVDLSEVEEVIRHDLALSYKLLRYLNSAAFGFRARIESIYHALTLLGTRPLRKWASLVAVTSIGRGKSEELLLTCMIRARFCERIGGQLDADRSTGDAKRAASEFFTLGMFSLLDAILDRPIREIVASLALPEHLRNALIDEPSPMADVLALIVAFERGNWEKVAAATRALALSDDIVCHAYRDAVAWASNTCRQLTRSDVDQAAA